jgi:hypothetical protein
MRLRRRGLPLLVGVCGLTSCIVAAFDHVASSSLKRELEDRSRHGLALARFSRSGAELETRFFDGHIEVQSIKCCQSTGAFRTVTHNRVVVVDGSAPHDATAEDRRDPPGGRPVSVNKGDQVVLMDNRGTVIARSDVRIYGFAVSPSPDEKQFAFVGFLGEDEPENAGVYVAAFHGQEVRMLADLDIVEDVARTGSGVRAMLDWSPDSKSLLLSWHGSVGILDILTGHLRNIAAGGEGLWSPSGEFISFVTSRRAAALFSVKTGQLKEIDPGQRTGSPLEWSPDGKYLLIRETEDSHVPYGCLWVYRVADAAFVPIPGYGVAGPRPQWVQLASPQRARGI